MDSIDKINLNNSKILLLGFGSVQKGVYHYLKYYFNYNNDNVYIVDKCKNAIYGLKTKKNIIIRKIDSTNFDELLEELKFKEGDIIIDLTYNSNTYYFIKKCLVLGINYINTSIEDINDPLIGTSIEMQQQTCYKIYEDFKKKNKIRSNILIECGQNPGCINMYVLYALNELNKMYYNTDEDNYDHKILEKAIDNYKIGTIYMSEIDQMEATNINDGIIYNTWSVNGFASEGFDPVELVCGIDNHYIKPNIPNKEYFENNKNVFFLDDLGINCYLKSVCPVLDNKKKVKFVEYEGALIHHGEIFDLGRIFGKKTPFMTYVYKFNKHLKKSIQDYVEKHGFNTEFDLKVHLNNNCDSYQVVDNIVNNVSGFDSIGCTILCGKNKIERIFWCGVISDDTDKNILKQFTPTVVQVVAGVLSGLSYIMEKQNQNKGLLNPCDLDVKYMLKKATPLLGKFFMAEVDKNVFSGNMKLFKHKLI